MKMLLKEEIEQRTGANGGLYQGAIEIHFAPPVDLALVFQLHNRLTQFPDIKLVRSVGSWDQGTSLVLSVEKPLAIMNILAEFPKVIATPAPVSTGGGSGESVLNFPGESEVVSRISLRMER